MHEHLDERNETMLVGVAEQDFSPGLLDQYTLGASTSYMSFAMMVQ